MSAYRIFLNSFKSIVQEDWKGIETNEKKKKQFISDGARAPNNTLFVKDNNGTQTVSQLQLLLEREPLEDAENQYLPIPFCQIVCAAGRLCTYIV